MTNNYSSYNEAELVARVAEGDERAFGRLVDQWWYIVLDHALMFIKAPDIAEEVTLDVFEKIWNKREKLKDVRSFKDWLYIVSRNEFISFTRKKIALVTIPASSESCVEEADLPGKSLELNELANLIKLGISRLRPHQQEILFMSRNEGLTHEQIAFKLGLSRHTVKGHLVNSLNFLRRFLNEHGRAAGSLGWILSALSQ